MRVMRVISLGGKILVLPKSYLKKLFGYYHTNNLQNLQTLRGRPLRRFDTTTKELLWVTRVQNLPPRNLRASETTLEQPPFFFSFFFF